MLSPLAIFAGSSEELSALKQAYTDSEGSMEKIINTVMCASYEDESRFREILLPLIESKELPAYKKFTHEPSSSKNKRLAKVSATNYVLSVPQQFRTVINGS